MDFRAVKKRKSIPFNMVEYPICIELTPCVDEVRLKRTKKRGCIYVQISFMSCPNGRIYGIYIKIDSLQYKRGDQIVKNENYLVIKSVREYYHKEVCNNYPRSFARARTLMSRYLKIDPLIIDANYNEGNLDEFYIHQDLQEFDAYQIYDRL